MKASNDRWRAALADRMPAELAAEIDVFKSEIALRKQNRIEERVFAETRLRGSCWAIPTCRTSAIPDRRRGKRKTQWDKATTADPVHAGAVTKRLKNKALHSTLPRTAQTTETSLNDRRTRNLRRALERCVETTEAEYRHAEETLRNVKAVLHDLRQRMDSIKARAARRGSMATSEAQSAIARISQRIDDGISNEIELTSRMLMQKKERLSKFTVTLFGRTMVGKSTIREAVTGGDGRTIGSGAQRTTRDIREYEWSQLRIVDTPGIGAFESGPDRDMALSIVDESDLLLFLVSSDSIQESSFRGMKSIRSQNKPMIFVLNVRLDLTQPVYMRRFLRSPESYLGDEALRGHLARIEHLAGDELGLRRVKIVPIHAQAAFLATRSDHAASSEALRHASRIDVLAKILTRDVVHFGPIRRLRTILDGTIVKLLDLEELLREQERQLYRSANDFKEKFLELDTWLNGYVAEVDGRIGRSASNLIGQFRRSVSSFVDENIERADVADRWNREIKERIDRWEAELQEQLVGEVREFLEEFNRELKVDLHIVDEFRASGPVQYDPFDTKRTLQWVSAGATALASVAGVAGVAGIIGAANFWNPVGWIASGIAITTFGISFLFQSREKKLQRRKASETHRLRDELDEVERRAAEQVKHWFNTEITNKLVRGIRYETRNLYDGMFQSARVIRDTVKFHSGVISELNQRLILKCGALLGAKRCMINAIARDPGLRTKFTWTDRGDEDFCREVGKALDEWIDGISQGNPRDMVASALTPARVSANSIDFKTRNHAVVPVSAIEMRRAIGKHGHNVKLASRLLGVRIELVDEER